MAPDVNTLPPSPRATRPTPARTPSNSNVTTSRRISTQMPPPPAPVYGHRSPVMSSNEQAFGPMRHPRPMTASELYLECEKEQEAVVNRLTRELTALRAQTASVASNASHSSTSTSASLLPVDISDPNPAHQLTGATHPTPSRRHRSSSSLSTRSTNNQTTLHSSTPAQAGVSQASADRAAAAGGPGNLSRQPSMTASGTSTPARQSLDFTRHGAPTMRPSISRDASFVSQSSTLVSSTAAHAGTPAPLSPNQIVTSPHLIDTAAYRTEMELVKAENEALRQRVRALERALQSTRRDSSASDVVRPDLSSPAVGRSPEPRMPASVAAWDGGVGGVAPPRERSESQSTTASSRRGLGGADDEVKFGESAASVGVGRGG